MTKTPNFHSPSPLSLFLTFLSFPFRSLSLPNRFHPPSLSLLPNPARGSGKLCKLPSGARGGPPAANAIWRIYGYQNAPRGSIFQLSPTFPMTQNVSFSLGLAAAAVIVDLRLVLLYRTSLTSAPSSFTFNWAPCMSISTTVTRTVVVRRTPATFNTAS